jgi:hypothetical protein
MSTHGPHHQFWKSKSMTTTIRQMTFVNFAANKHLSTTPRSLNHDTKSLPFAQKAAIITYCSQLNPINTHNPRPLRFIVVAYHYLTYVFRYQSGLFPSFPIKTFRMHQSPLSVCYMFNHANDPNICYTQTLLLCTFLYRCDISRLLIT